MNFLKDLVSVENHKSKLKSVPIDELRDRSSVNLKEQSADELEGEDAIFKQFMQSGCGSWFELIKEQTFSSTFAKLVPSEALVIVRHWDDLRALKTKLLKEDATDAVVAKSVQELLNIALDKLELSGLKQRLSEAIYTEIALSPSGLAFVKLSTRSPKDSKKALAAAHLAYDERLHKLTPDTHEVETLSDNDKWRLLCETTTQSGAVNNASSALILLLDSDRVYEDLEYALKGPPSKNTHYDAVASTSSSSTDDDEHAAMVALEWNMDLVARAWDPRLKPESEFRGICWDHKLTCVGQYFHPLIFPELFAIKEQIEKDIWETFQKHQTTAAIASVGGNCIIDFAWLGNGEVVIIEINPFDGIVLGTFPASTGLFLWENAVDNAIMKGEAPFEFRIRDVPLDPHALKSQCNKDWRDIIYSPKSIKSSR